MTKKNSLAAIICAWIIDVYLIYVCIVIILIKRDQSQYFSECTQ